MNKYTEFGLFAGGACVVAAVLYYLYTQSAANAASSDVTSADEQALLQENELAQYAQYENQYQDAEYAAAGEAGSFSPLSFDISNPIPSSGATVASPITTTDNSASDTVTSPVTIPNAYPLPLPTGGHSLVEDV